MNMSRSNNGCCYCSSVAIYASDEEKQLKGETIPGHVRIEDLTKSPRYCKALPFCFKVVTGFCSLNEKIPSIITDGLYNAHVVKRTEVVMIQDKVGNHYKVPLYTPSKFGIVYDKSGRQTFSSVGEIMDIIPRPKVVAVKSGFEGKSSKSTLEGNEVLVIIEVRQPKFKRRNSYLKVYSMTKSMIKKLSRACEATFTTDPYYTKMYITELMQYVPDLFPCRVKLFTDFKCEGSACTLPHCPPQEVLLQGRHTIESMVVSTVRKNGERKRTEFIDIPVSTGIRVVVVDPDRNEDLYNNLYRETRSLFKHFDLAKLQTIIDAPSDSASYINQALKYFVTIRNDCRCAMQSNRPPHGHPQAASYSHAPKAKDGHKTKSQARDSKEHDVPHYQTRQPKQAKATVTEDIEMQSKPGLKMSSNTSSVDCSDQKHVRHTQDGEEWTNTTLRDGSICCKEPISVEPEKHQQSSHGSNIQQEVKIRAPTKKTYQPELTSYRSPSVNLPCFKKSGPHNIFVELDILENAPPTVTVTHENTEQHHMYQPLHGAATKSSSSDAMYMQLCNQGLSRENESPVRKHSCPAQTASLHRYQTLLPTSRSDEQTYLTVSNGMSSSGEKMFKFQPQESLQVALPRMKTNPKPLSNLSEHHNSCCSPLEVPTQSQSVFTTPTSQSQQLGSHLNSIQGDYDRLEDFVQSQEFSPVSMQGSGVVYQELASLSIDEVQVLLDALGLEQYKAVFLLESIDGEILRELDEAVLAEELDITVKADRDKLMEVINGDVSPRAIIEEFNTDCMDV